MLKDDQGRVAVAGVLERWVLYVKVLRDSEWAECGRWTHEWAAKDEADKLMDLTQVWGVSVVRRTEEEVYNRRRT